MKAEDHYERLRGKGWRAIEAWRAAKIRESFDSLSDQELVKLEIEADDLPYDYDYVDDWHDMPERKREDLKKEIRRRLNYGGPVCLVAYWRLSDEEPWEMADACGGFLDADDAKDNGYDDDLRRAAIEAYEDALDLHATELASRATLAGP